MRKFLAVLCSIALMAGTITPTPIWAASVYDEDGDIIENPWGDIFETTEAPTEEETTTEAPTEEETTTEAPTEEETTTVVVEGPIAITSQPKDVTVASGYYAFFDVVAEGDSLTYQWQLSTDGGATWRNTTVKGYNTNKVRFTMNAANNGRLTRCRIKDAEGNTVYSDSAMLICDESAVPEASVKITSQPVDGYAVSGIRTTFTVEATGNIEKYRWQVSRDGGETWSYTTVQGYNEATMYVKVTSATEGRLVRCVMTDADTGAVVISDTAEICMYPNTITIVTQPKKTYAKNGESYNISVEATGEGLTYQWYVSKDDGATWSATTVTGAQTDTATLKMSSTMSGRMLRCVITDTYGNKVTTNGVAMILTSLEITKQPTDVTVASGTSFDVSVEATGSNITYQWQVSKDGGSTWSNTTVTGAQTDTATLKMSSTLSGRMLRCVITEDTGNKVISDAITMTME